MALRALNRFSAFLKKAHRPCCRPVRANERVSLFTLNSELELQSKLHLARRTRVAGGEARVSNHAKSRAAYLGRTARLAKVRMIKKIENFPAELKNLVLTDLGPL